MTHDNPPPSEPTGEAGAPVPPGGWAQAPPRHPQATTVLVLGIVGIVACQVLAPIAWWMGSKAMTEINANPGGYSGEGEVRAGRILGIVGSALLVLSVLFLIGMLVLLLFGAAASGGFHGGMNDSYAG